MTETDHDIGRVAVPWRVRDALFGFALVLGSFLAVALWSLLRGNDGPEESTPLTTLWLALSQGVLFLAVWLFGIRRYRVSWQAVGFAQPQARRSLLLPWLALVLSLAFAILYGVVMKAVGFDSLEPPVIPSTALGEGAYRIVNIGVIGIVGPLAEEVFYRGFLLAALVCALGPFRGVVVGSAIFALSHAVVSVMLPVFVSGLLLSWLYLKTRSLWPPFVAHAAQNLIVIFAVMSAA